MHSMPAPRNLRNLWAHALPAPMHRLNACDGLLRRLFKLKILRKLRLKVLRNGEVSSLVPCALCKSVARRSGEVVEHVLICRTHLVKARSGDVCVGVVEDGVEYALQVALHVLRMRRKRRVYKRNRKLAYDRHGRLLAVCVKRVGDYPS